jgi:hypothetical protein
LLLAAAGGACSSTPANVAGDYTINLTDEANNCNLMNWNQGSGATGISVTITQDSSSASVTINGAIGAYVKAVLGSAVFASTVDADGLSGTLFGTTSANMGGCTYTYDADLDATLTGDTLTGTLKYTPKTNGSPDCGVLLTCSNVQDFNGTRPPM